MRRAMARAAVGDDDYGEDPTVNELQHRAAGILGTEWALFVPTATVANLIALMCHCQRRGAQLFLGQDSHLHLYEHGGAAQGQGWIRCQSVTCTLHWKKGFSPQQLLWVCTHWLPGKHYPRQQ